MDHQVSISVKNNVQNTVNLTADTTTSDEIPYGEFSKGSILVTAITGATTLSFWGAEKQGGTYVQIYDSSNAAKAQGIAATRGYAIPTECAGFPFLRLICNGSSTATAIVTRKG